MRRKKILAIACLLFSALTSMPHGARADSTAALTVVPVVIDEKAKAQDILNETITITNTSNRKLLLYPSVNDEQDTSGQQQFSHAEDAQQLSDSLSNWIELSRAMIQLPPGQSQSVPFVIRVPTDTVPGSYHAIVSFYDGSTIADATSRPPVATMTVNVDMQADIKELMQLNTFSTDNIVFAGDDVLFKYQLQNTGNQNLDPRGDIRIYDRKGEEVASVDVNSGGKSIAPDQTAQLASVWSAAQGFGKYKAVINVDYGANQVASVQDVIYFWVIPWKQVLGISVTTLVLLIVMALYMHRWIEEKHFGRLAAAGLLKAEAILHMEKEPEKAIDPEKIKAAIQETTVSAQKKAAELSDQFSDFKRKGFVPPNLAVKPAVTPPPPPQQSAPAASATIDLKKMWQPQQEHTITEVHVINLKK
ncbi:MAG TPA: hypothetical protein VMU25_04510 [Candidatus Paceibacterota bacterium]|nr:hypothetical protein [Candidatus Paceibacterota bacterium]